MEVLIIFSYSKAWLCWKQLTNSLQYYTISAICSVYTELCKCSVCINYMYPMMHCTQFPFQVWQTNLFLSHQTLSHKTEIQGRTTEIWSCHHITMGSSCFAFRVQAAGKSATQIVNKLIKTNEAVHSLK